VDTLKDALMVPAAAVQQSPQGTFVYVVKADGTVDFRKVEVQLTDGETTALRKGIANGERVVVNGLDKLRPGSKVLDDATPAPKAAK
jgi:multidrug efflux system membrane fusion protein